MARRRQNVRLSSGELEIMSLLWQRGPLTLSQAHAAIPRTIGYTTVQTRLNRLVDKGHVTRSDDRPAKYAAAVPQERVSAGHLDQLLDKVSGGRVVPLVAHLIDRGSLTPEDIQELKKLIAQAEREAGLRSN